MKKRREKELREREEREREKKKNDEVKFRKDDMRWFFSRQNDDEGAVQSGEIKKEPGGKREREKQKKTSRRDLKAEAEIRKKRVKAKDHNNQLIRSLSYHVIRDERNSAGSVDTVEIYKGGQDNLHQTT